MENALKKPMKETLLQLLEEALPGLDPRAVSMESRLQADLGLDSMSGMVLLMEIEDAFQVELGEDANFETVGDVCRYLSAHRQA